MARRNDQKLELPANIAQFMLQRALLHYTGDVTVGLGSTPGYVVIPDQVVASLFEGRSFLCLLQSLNLTRVATSSTDPQLAHRKQQNWHRINEALGSSLGLQLTADRKSSILCNDIGEMTALLREVFMLTDCWIFDDLSAKASNADAKEEPTTRTTQPQHSQEVRHAKKEPHRIPLRQTPAPHRSETRSNRPRYIEPKPMSFSPPSESVSRQRTPLQLIVDTPRPLQASELKGRANAALLRAYVSWVCTVQTFSRYAFSSQCAHFRDLRRRAILLFQARWRLVLHLRARNDALSKMRPKQQREALHRCHPILDHLRSILRTRTIPYRTTVRYFAMCCTPCASAAIAIVGTPMSRSPCDACENNSQGGTLQHQHDHQHAAEEKSETATSCTPQPLSPADGQEEHPVASTAPAEVNVQPHSRVGFRSLTAVQAALRARMSWEKMYLRFHTRACLVFYQRAPMRRKCFVLLFVVVLLGKLRCRRLTRRPIDALQKYNWPFGACSRCRPILLAMARRVYHDRSPQRVAKFTNLLCWDAEGSTSCRDCAESLLGILRVQTAKKFVCCIYVLLFIAKLTPDTTGERRQRFEATHRWRKRVARKGRREVPGNTLVQVFARQRSSLCARCYPLLNSYARVVYSECLLFQLPALPDFIRYGPPSNVVWLSTLLSPARDARWKPLLCKRCDREEMLIQSLEIGYEHYVRVMMAVVRAAFKLRTLAISRKACRKYLSQNPDPPEALYCYRCSCIIHLVMRNTTRWHNYDAIHKFVRHFIAGPAVQKDQKNQLAQTDQRSQNHQPQHCGKCVAAVLRRWCRAKNFALWLLTSICLYKLRRRNRQPPPPPTDSLQNCCMRCRLLFTMVRRQIRFLSFGESCLSENRVRLWVYLDTKQATAKILTRQLTPLCCKKCTHIVAMGIETWVANHNHAVWLHDRSAREAKMSPPPRPKDCDEGFWDHCRMEFDAKASTMLQLAHKMVNERRREPLRTRQQEILYKWNEVADRFCKVCRNALHRFVVAELQQWVALEAVEEKWESKLIE